MMNEEKRDHRKCCETEAVGVAGAVRQVRLRLPCTPSALWLRRSKTHCLGQCLPDARGLKKSGLWKALSRCQLNVRPNKLEKNVPTVEITVPSPGPGGCKTVFFFNQKNLVTWKVPSSCDTCWTPGSLGGASDLSEGGACAWRGSELVCDI